MIYRLNYINARKRTASIYFYATNSVTIKKCDMKHFPVIFICLLGITACHKSHNLSTENNGTRLTSIVRDSAGTFDFVYSNNLIKSVKRSLSNADPPVTAYDTLIFENLNTDSNQLVSVGYSSNLPEYSITYILTSSKLPLRAFYTDSGIVRDYARFIYFPNTDILDSVNLNSAYNSENILFRFNYTGQI